MRLNRIFFSVLVFLLIIILPFINLAQAKEDIIYIIPIKGVIDKGQAQFVKRSILEAEEIHAEAIVFDLDTPGGEINSAIDISNTILDTTIPTTTWINNEATSAGVIISISSDDIYAVPRATIGAAETRPKEEKYISYWSSKLRNVAEIKGRDPELVAAMADADVVIEGVKEKGKILSLTTHEAIKLGLIDKEVRDIDDLVKEISPLQKAKIVKAHMNLAERLAHMATDPYVAPVLLTLGIVGTVIEILTPGFGIPGIIGLVAFSIFFGGNLLAGAAQYWMLGLFVLGLILLIIEMFIPGFGVFGVAGILSIIGSIIVAFPSPREAIITISIAFIASIVIIFFLVKYLVKTTVFDRIILSAKQGKAEGYVASLKDTSQYMNKYGVTLTVLRPAGRAVIGDEILDVVTEGEYIPAGTDIKVVKIAGNKITVKKIERESE